MSDDLQVDWGKPIEAYHEDGRVVAGEAACPDEDGERLFDPMLEGKWRLFRANGLPWKPCGWRIRNVAEPVRECENDIGKRMEGLVRRIADEHDYPCQTVDWRTEARAIVALMPEPVDADLVEAREICARVAMSLKFDDEPETWAAEYREGAYDRDPEMEYVLSVLRARALERDSREG